MEIFEFENLIMQLLFKEKDARERKIPFLVPDLFDTYENKRLAHLLTSGYGRKI